MKIYQAGIEDAAIVHHCGKDFFKESNWGHMTLDPDRIRESLIHILTNQSFIVVVAVDDNGIPAGFVIWSLENPWTIEKQALMVLFYVRPEYRTGGTASKVLDLSLDLCKNAGAKMFFSSSTAGFDDGGVNERAFTLLLKRRGFKGLGTFLCKGE